MAGAVARDVLGRAVAAVEQGVQGMQVGSTVEQRVGRWTVLVT